MSRSKSSTVITPSADTITLPDSGVVTAPESAPAITLEAALAYIVTHYRLPSVRQAMRALDAARTIAVDAATQGQEDARLPIIGESSRHSTSASKGQAREARAILRDSSALSADERKARSARERRLNAATILALR